MGALHSHDNHNHGHGERFLPATALDPRGNILLGSDIGSTAAHLGSTTVTN